MPLALAPADPFVIDVERKLAGLFSRYEFGLAFHLLRAARRVLPDRTFAFGEAELRLAAMSGHNNHATMQGSDLLARLLREALSAVEAQCADAGDAASDDATVARRIVLHAVCCPLVLFHSASPAAQVLQALNGVAPRLSDGLRAVTDAVMEAARSGLPVTLASLRSVGQETEAEANRYADACRAALLAKIDFFSELRFSFLLGNKIRAVLARVDGPVGLLRMDIGRDGQHAAGAARSFAAQVPNRAAVIFLLDAAEAQVNSRTKGIDGAARERLVANILELAALCDEFVQAREAVPAVRNSSYRMKLLGIREAVCLGADRAVRALGAFAEATTPLSAAAARFAASVLERLQGSAEGRRSPPGPIDHLLAVHAPLLWLSGLQFGRSWLPSPYQPERVVEAILRASEPAVPDGEARVRAFEDAVRARMNEGSFVAARLLVQTGAFFDVPEAERAALLEAIEGDLPARRGALEREIEEVRRRVERMERMGHLATHDDAQRLASLLDGVEPAKLPGDVSLDYRSEDEEDAQVLDFCSAESLLEDVRAHADALLDTPRREILVDLDRMAATGAASQHDIERIRGLVVGQDDLLTAREWMEFLESGRGLPETPSPNPRFRAFFPAVPEALARLSKDELAGLPEWIRKGSDLGPLAFSRVPDRRRQDVLELHAAWAELRRRVQGGAHIDNVPSFLTHLLDRAGLSAALLRPDVARSNARRKVYVAEVQLRIPGDAESVLLPDFGSMTSGNYRICAVAKPPSPSEISVFCDGLGSLGMIVLAMDLMDVERRRNLAVELVKQGRRVLVIDDSVFLFALSEPEFRPLTLFECAQPFSFAAPYLDYGNAAVPPEMFFGRDAEQRKIYEPLGSCVVYGGRRLGKTALLRHVEAQRHDPENGVVVTYVNILDIGNNALPSMVWEYASRVLPRSIFPSSVASADAFAAGVRQWLEADTKRRILVLFDESDRFIEADARDGFREFIRLQGLMDATGRRFKMVLAGLHNVTRLAHTENPPLKQIAADPLRIGALMDDELKDAELLVTRPLAAMGYDFESRGNAWRILSHCNYYPVLVQTFCQRLVDELQKETVHRRKPVRTVTGEHVRRVLESEQVVKEIGEKFDYTIREIDPRYELIACIMANRALMDGEAGRLDDGISAVEVRDRAVEHWPAAFDQLNRLSVIEDLLDEMEGLGVLRRVPGDRWALRSHAILRLLGNRERVEAKLYSEFLDREAPPAYEPRSMRRPLHAMPAYAKVPDGHLSPLTMGQEHDLLARDPANEAPVRLIFGNALAEAGLAAAALSTAGPLAASGVRAAVTAKAWAALPDLMRSAKQGRPRGAEVALLVVDTRAEWDGSWVEQALKSRAVLKDGVRFAFVGGPQHAMRWVMDARFRPPPARLRVMPLEPWSNALIDDSLHREHLAPEQFRDALRRATGGFHRPMCQAFAGSIVRDRFAAKVNLVGDRLLTDPGLLADLGLVRPMDEVFRRIADYAGDGGRITPFEISEGVLVSIPAARHLTGQQVADFGFLMGLLVPEPLRVGDTEELRPYGLNALAAGALRAPTPAAVA
jgi:hypothetical protein